MRYTLPNIPVNFHRNSRTFDFCPYITQCQAKIGGKNRRFSDFNENLQECSGECISLIYVRLHKCHQLVANATFFNLMPPCHLFENFATFFVIFEKIPKFDIFKTKYQSFSDYFQHINKHFFKFSPAALVFALTQRFHQNFCQKSKFC